MDEKKIARAEHKYARISPRKVEIVCNMIRGKDAKVAMAMMQNTPKAGCELMVKVLKSAMANAENNCINKRTSHIMIAVAERD